MENPNSYNYGKDLINSAFHIFEDMSMQYYLDLIVRLSDRYEISDKELAQMKVIAISDPSKIIITNAEQVPLHSSPVFQVDEEIISSQLPPISKDNSSQNSEFATPTPVEVSKLFIEDRAELPKNVDINRYSELPKPDREQYRTIKIHELFLEACKKLGVPENAINELVNQERLIRDRYFSGADRDTISRFKSEFTRIPARIESLIAEYQESHQNFGPQNPSFSTETSTV